MIRNILITIYILVILGISATVRADYRILPVTGDEAQATQLYKGEVAVTIEGTAYLVMSDDQVFELKSQEDVTSFNGQLVLIKGFENKYKIQPIEMLDTDPLLDDQHSQKAIPVLTVLKITEITE